MNVKYAQTTILWHTHLKGMDKRKFKPCYLKLSQISEVTYFAPIKHVLHDLHPYFDTSLSNFVYFTWYSIEFNLSSSKIDALKWAT